MLIPPDDAEHFLRVYQEALAHAAASKPEGTKDFVSLRRLLYEPKSRKSPPTEDADLLAALKTAVYDDFIVGRHLAKSTEMVGPQEKVYWVKGLTTELDEILPPWVWVKTTVMQFKGHWICDGLIESRNVLIGPNMMREYAEVIREAKAVAQAKQKAAGKRTKAVKAKETPMKENKVREERIVMEIVVDAYDEQERAIGWHCYLDDKLGFPFKARCVNVRTISPLEEGDEVEVAAIADEEECEHEMFVEVRWTGRSLAVPLSQLEALGADKATREAVADWHYWVGRGYHF